MLAVILVPKLSSFTADANKKAVLVEARNFYTAYEGYKHDKGEEPDNLAKLKEYLGVDLTNNSEISVKLDTKPIEYSKKFKGKTITVTIDSQGVIDFK